MDKLTITNLLHELAGTLKSTEYSDSYVYKNLCPANSARVAPARAKREYVRCYCTSPDVLGVYVSRSTLRALETIFESSRALN
jgi:hypothetical protein